MRQRNRMVRPPNSRSDRASCGRKALTHESVSELLWGSGLVIGAAPETGDHLLVPGGVPRSLDVGRWIWAWWGGGFGHSLWEL